MSFPRQFTIFALVGVAAAVAHYAALISLVELAKWRPVPATLVGYVCGGVVSYFLNRRHTYRSARPHDEATWRFATVAAIGFGLTWLFMFVLHDRLGLQYIAAQLVTTGVVMSWSFLAHKWFTFRDA